MARKIEIKLRVVSHDVCEIKKDDNLFHLIGMSYGFHKTMMEAASKSKGKKYKEGEYFNSILTKLELNEEETALLSLRELRLLSDWIDKICQMMLELNSIDLKDKKLKKYFKLSQDFLLKLKPIIENN